MKRRVAAKDVDGVESSSKASDGSYATPTTADAVFLVPTPLSCEQVSVDSSPSLARSIAGYSPPRPGPQQLAAASLVQASVELAALVEAARCAAIACPESMPLVEALCAAVADELVLLHGQQSSSALDSESAAALSNRVSELRAATAEGLQVLQVALNAGISVDISETVLQERSNSKEREMAQMFGAVATDMRQRLLEIRRTKEKQATARKEMFAA